MTSNTNTVPARSGGVLFLPDFCAGRAVLAVVLIVELVALIIALVRQPITESFWIDLAAISMFLLWIGLGSATVLCRASQVFTQLSAAKASLLALALLAAVVMVVSEGVYQIGSYMSGGMPSILTIFPENHTTFVLRNMGIGFIVSALALRYFYISAEWKRTIESEAQARIHALQARIRPHFLFNSMNTIASLTRSNPQLAEEAVEDLADLFRASLSDARQRIPLSDELNVARVYQRIEQLRLGARLTVLWQIDAPEDAMIPSLLLQPLLENAIYHGIEKLPNGGEVTIAARCAADFVEIEVANPLANASMSQTLHGEHRGNKLALDNIRQRLQLAWPGEAAVIASERDDRYVVTLRFPYTKRTEH